MAPPRRSLACGVLLAAACGVCLAAAKNDLTNPGFESVRGGKVHGWSTPSYWSGAIEPVADKGAAHGGRRCARLTSALSRKKHWGRALTYVRTKLFVGRRLRYSMWVRGKGELLLGYIQYVPPEVRKPHYAYVYQEQPTALTEQWQQVVFEFALADPRTRRIAPIVEIRGEGSVAWLDDGALTSAAQPGFELRVEPHHAMVPVGGRIDITARVLRKGTPLTSGGLLVLTPTDKGEPAISKLSIGKGGAATWSFQASKEPGLHAVTFSHPDTGLGEPVTIDVTDAATCGALEQAARKVRLPTPAHLLFIGDSLTDFHRGHNYVDKVGFWLWKTYGAKATVRNAGVGGDFISRVWQRLNRDPKSYRLAMYDDLYSPKPTHVFFFLGHNDSKLSSRSGYKDPCVAIDTFEKEYRLAIRKIQKDTGARIIVLSASSSVYEITKATSDKRLAAGRANNLFGKPEALEQFNAVARRVAAECGADYLDVYEPTRRHPDKPSLFMPDGVHVNEAGNRLLALEILKHLAGR